MRLTKVFGIVASAAIMFFALPACNPDGKIYDPADPVNGHKVDPTPTPDPTPEAEWTEYEHGGFTYKFRTELVKSKDSKVQKEIEDARTLLEKNLDEMNTFVPEEALKVMKPHPIWLERDLTDGAAWFHASKDWLEDQYKTDKRYLPEKAQCVELCNYVHYVEWTKQNQPYMVFHEFCHLYHLLGLPNGYDNADVLKAYNNAVDKKLYINTPYRLVYNPGGKDDIWENGDDDHKAYCLTNQMEFFSEICEAYWGENDYYPFNYEDLKKYDPVAFDLMVKVWGERPDKVSE